MKLKSIVITGLIFLALSHAAHADECDAADIAVATTPAFPTSASRLRDFWKQKELADAGADVLLIGDSHISNWPLALLQGTFPDEKVVKYGIGGDRIQNIIYRVNALAPIAKEPRLIVVFSGANNVYAGDSLCQMKLSMNVLLDAIKTKFPKSKLMILETPPKGADFNENEELRIEFSKELKNIALERQAIFIPLPSDILSCQTTLSGGINKLLNLFGMRQCIYFKTDNTHLSTEGYDILMQAVSHSDLKQ